MASLLFLMSFRSRAQSVSFSRGLIVLAERRIWQILSYIFSDCATHACETIASRTLVDSMCASFQTPRSARGLRS